MSKEKEIEFAPGIPYKKNEPFFKVENSLIDCGILCMLPDKAVLLYFLLLRKSFHKKGYIYMDQIVKSTNTSKDHISRYLPSLVKIGLITITNQSKRYGYKKYIVNDMSTAIDTKHK